MADPIFLPRAESAEVPVSKLGDYVLSAVHPSGRHKARVFRSVLDIGEEDWRFLRDQLLERVPRSPVTAIRPKAPFGTEYEVRIEVDGLNGVTSSVITGWPCRRTDRLDSSPPTSSCPAVREGWRDRAILGRDAPAT